tara:strand:- start:2457 stop:2873 length:417 start_codon:yes stop_codon:yes gene_type:complete
METNKLILKQVALKGAVQLSKDQFKVDQDISTQVDTVINIATQLNEWLLNGYQDEVITKIESAGMKAEQKETTGGHTASDGQVKFLRDLLGQIPEEEQPKYKDVILSDSITWQYAKENIPVLQELAYKAKKKTDKAPF